MNGRALSRIFGLTLAAALAAGAVLPGVAYAQVPASNQALLLLRTLAYDRKLASRVGSELTIAVVFREGSSESEGVVKELSAALDGAAAKSTVAGLQPKTVKVPFTTTAELEATLARLGADAVYLCPGLGGQVTGIVQLTRSKSILTLTGTESYVDDGASIGFVRRGAKSAILIDLKAAKAEGADLDAALLKVAEVRK